MSLAPHVLVPGPLADEVEGAVVPLGDTAAHHLRRVLRLIDGSPLVVTDGAGMLASGELVTGGVRLTAVPRVCGVSLPRLVLAQSLAKGRRADEAVRTACELGVDRIIPIVAERTQGRPDDRTAGAVVERWQALAVSALEQSRGVHLAQVTASRTTAQLAGDGDPSDAPDGSERTDRMVRTVRLVTVPGAPSLTAVLAAALTDAEPGTPQIAELWVAVGPEGGWSTAEVDLLAGSGWLPVGLGPTVLRTEHAGPVAIAVLAALAGRWQGASAAGG